MQCALKFTTIAWLKYKNNIKTIIYINSFLIDDTPTLHVINSLAKNCCRTFHVKGVPLVSEGLK